MMLKEGQRTVDDLTSLLRSQERKFIKNQTGSKDEQEALVVKIGIKPSEKPKRNHKKNRNVKQLLQTEYG